MKRGIAIALGALLSITLNAAEYGDDHTKCDSRYFIATGTATIREAPDKHAHVLFTGDAGDIFYVDSNEIVMGADGSQWLRISGAEERYIPYEVLSRENNPEYVAPLTAEDRVFQTPRWLLIVLASLFALYAALFLWLRRHHLFDNFTGKTQSNGMKKIIFYNPEPYLCCLEIILWIAVAFLAAFITIMLLGGLAFGMGWATNILAKILIWALIVVGYGGGVILAGMVFTDKEFWIKLLCGGGAVLLFVLASHALDWRESFYAFGENAAELGGQVFEVFNIFQIGLAIISVFWKYALVAALIPIVVLGICAIGFIAFNSILVASEKLNMKRYGIAHPCPDCHQPSEPAIYYSGSYPLPRDVELRPGPWGVFHIVHPVTGEKMPTRFSDGKDFLPRQCPHCGGMINAKIGTEKHVAFAGITRSGKTALMYRLMGCIRDMKIGDETISRMTDTAGSDIKDFDKVYAAIQGGGKMTRMPEKTQQRRHKSLQILVNNPKHEHPYRLFFNDVAGEVFTLRANRAENAPFLKDVQAIVFMIDPKEIKTSNLDLSPRMIQWYRSQGIDPETVTNLTAVDEAVDRLMNMLKDSYHRNIKDIHLIVNLAKPDEGYLGDCPRNHASLRSFVADDLGLGSQIARWENSFKSVRFYAVSALEDAKTSCADALLSDIFNKLDISFKGVSEEALRKSWEAYDKQRQERETAAIQARPGGMKAPAIVAAVIAIVVVLAALTTYISIDLSHKSANYRATTEKVNRVFKDKGYDGAVLVANRALGELRFTSRQRGKLEDLRDGLMHEKKNKIEALTSTLSVNFAMPKDGISNVETSAKYKAKENLINIQNMLDELETLDSENEDLVAYRKEFDKLLKKYKIKL